MIMVGVTGGWSGLRNLFGRLLTWRVGPSWYAVAVLGPAGIIVVAVVIHVLLGSDALATASFQFRSAALALGMLVLIRFFAGGGLGEELGWRGFLLPRLQQRHDALTASLYIGVVHGFWHLPAYGLAGTVLLTVFTTSGAVIATWIYNSTASLLLVALMHATFNAYVAFSEVVIPGLDDEMGWVLWTFALLVVAAFAVVRATGRDHLSRRSAT